MGVQIILNRFEFDFDIVAHTHASHTFVYNAAYNILNIIIILLLSH